MALSFLTFSMMHFLFLPWENYAEHTYDINEHHIDLPSLHQKNGKTFVDTKVRDSKVRRRRSVLCCIVPLSAVQVGGVVLLSKLSKTCPCSWCKAKQTSYIILTSLFTSSNSIPKSRAEKEMAAAATPQPTLAHGGLPASILTGEQMAALKATADSLCTPGKGLLASSDESAG